jgi:hypothetical protein
MRIRGRKLQMSLPAELRALDDQLDAAERDALALAAGLTEERANWRAAPGSWSVAECLDHLAATNREYLAAMYRPAEKARTQERLRRGQAAPGRIGAWFVRSLEPPVKMRARAPKSTLPRAAPPLASALAAFVIAQSDTRAFVQANSDLDLAGVRFPNPFVPVIRFSLATGLHVIAAHERRHLWQAWRVR